MSSDVSNEEYYYVDDLFRNLGLFDDKPLEAWTAKDVVRALNTNSRIKYLSHIVPMSTPESEVQWFNLDKKRINFSRFKGFTITQICKLADMALVYASSFSQKQGSLNYFTAVKDWVYREQRVGKVVSIDFTAIAEKANYSNAVDFITNASVKDIAEVLITAIVSVDKSILLGGNYAELKFTFSKVNPLIPLADRLALKLSKALVLIQKKYPEFDFLTMQSPAINSFIWAFNTYDLADQAIKKLYNLIQSQGISLRTAEGRSKVSTELKNEAIKDTLLEGLEIEIGDIVLFSVQAFSTMCPLIKEHNALIGIDESGKDVCVDSMLREMAPDSFFAGRIENFNSNYLDIKVRYKLQNSITFVTIPVPWSALLPNITDVFLNAQQGERSYRKIRAATDASKFYSKILGVPLLMTNKNCATLSRPLINFAYSFN